MRAKLINEAIKHLGPKSEEELENAGGIFKIFKQLKKDLPALEDLIEKRLGCRIKLEASLESSSDKEFIRITSGSLIEFLGDTLVKTIFSDINLYWWGGTLAEDGSIWFNPKVSYSHPRGGSNGTDFLWNSLWYKDGKWIEGNIIYR